MLYRSIDGSDNDLDAPSENAAGTAFSRTGPANYADGISTLVEGPNPRTISNQVIGEGDAAVANDRGLSGMMYAWGQFIDHDLTRASGDRVNAIDITIPDGDPIFGDDAAIAMTRAKQAAGTGAGTDTPAIAVNNVTGWLDGSMVYGSDPITAAALRLADGRMVTSDGDNLPIVGGGFMAGDVRVMENPSLTALQTIFVREHNWQVERLAAADPSLTGDELYEMARAIVTAEIAHITYSEFLPHLLGTNAITAYSGYDSSIDARLSIEFSGAAYRWGHSTVSAVTERKNEQGEVVGPELTLRDTFFLTPDSFAAHGGADGFLRHLGADVSQAMDARIVEDLRNFLFDPPVGQDLAAINIQRGRDLGLGTLNQTREALGLDAYTDFDQITSDAATVAALRATYASVDEIDLWTGGLAEEARGDAFIGETFARIVGDQFLALRDGDRFWYQNQGFDPATLAMIEGTRLSDIILRNTDTEHLQADVFLAYERRAPDADSEDPDLPQLIVGSAADETLIGGEGDDILVGGGGANWLQGGAGDDLYKVDSLADLVYEAPGGGYDTVIAKSGFYLYPEIEALTLAPEAGDAFGYGNDLDNTITGNDGNNLLIGGGGADTLLGGDGDDSLFGQAGDDFLYAGTGIDTLAGGDGDDRYFVDGLEDLIYEAADGGDDLVNALVGPGFENAYYLYANIEGLRLLGNADSWGSGNDLDNYIEGNSGDNWLFGGAGNDTLDGAGDWDVLFGDVGADTFVFRPGTDVDTICDFNPGEDKILLSGFAFSDFAMVQAAMFEIGGTTAINLGGEDMVVISGVAMASLGAEDFIFA
jgi:Ca2+-binding RTX toxin-like protein